VGNLLPTLEVHRDRAGAMALLEKGGETLTSRPEFFINHWEIIFVDYEGESFGLSKFSSLFMRMEQN
jgi:hypothetical protein